MRPGHWTTGKYRPWNAPAHVGLPPLVAHHLVHHKPLVDLGAHARNLRKFFQNLQNISLQTLKIHFPKLENTFCNLGPWNVQALCAVALSDVGLYRTELYFLFHVNVHLVFRYTFSKQYEQTNIANDVK